MNWLIRAGTVRGHPVYVHWSVPLICFVILAFNYEAPVTAVVSTAAYFAMLVIHEAGHATVARMRRCAVKEIVIYPIHGYCRFFPNSAEDHVFIAWGGVIAQLVVALPIMIVTKLFGGTHILALDAALAILGYLSFAIALLNLLPVRPLDGAIAWSVVPILLRRFVRRVKRKRDLTPMEAMEEALKKAGTRKRRM